MQEQLTIIEEDKFTCYRGRHDYSLSWKIKEIPDMPQILSNWIINVEDIDIKIGNETYIIPHELSALAKKISESQVLLTYKDNWDDNGAAKTNLSTFKKAITFLINSANAIKDKGLLLIPPFIDLMADGSVYLHWDTYKADFLIIFKKEKQDISYFFGENKADKIPFKGGILNNSPIKEYILSWMKDYLT